MNTGPALATPPTHPHRLVYFGTPDVAVAPLLALHAAGFDIPLVITRVDKRRGRGSTLSPSPVKAAALDLGLAVSHQLDDCLSVGADLGVVVAYGRIVPTPVLAELAMLNLHFSLLPRWRGAAPVERALLAGDAETGVCVMALAPELDTGDVYARQVVPIDDAATLDSLRDELVDVGCDLLVRTLREGIGAPEPQVGEVTYAHKITTEDHQLDFTGSARAAWSVTRLGRAWTEFRGTRLKVNEAELVPDLVDGAPGTLVGDLVATGDGALRLVTVQPEGKRSMAVADWRNGVQPAEGERLG
ncbi:MAG: methionyl-tRNA formyltransferase [Actinomycetota bacterium]